MAQEQDLRKIMSSAVGRDALFGFPAHALCNSSVLRGGCKERRCSLFCLTAFSLQTFPVHLRNMNASLTYIDGL